MATIGRPRKEAGMARDVPLNFRVTRAVKDAIDAMVTQRAAETGDDSITGWFLALVHREARTAGVPIGVSQEVPKGKGPAKRRASKNG